MAASVSVSYQRKGSGRIAIIDWVSASDGSATGTVVLDGEVKKFVTNPGSAAPTDNYDITLVDEDGLDVAEGQLANRDTTNSEAVYPYKEVSLTGSVPSPRPLYHSGAVVFTLANAGDTKAGRLKVFMR